MLCPAPAMSPHPPTLELVPIGVVHSPWRDKHSAPRQPAAAVGVCGAIELFANGEYEHALEDLATWSHVWVLFWFHLNPGWHAKVLPPRSHKKRGVFATRSPHRPNPLGMSVVELQRIDGRTLHVRNVDMLDQTPVFDIKPYLAYTDAPAGANSGWLEQDSGPYDRGPMSGEDPAQPYQVDWEPLARAQLAWLQPHLAFDLQQAAESVLSIGPTPHPYRRIRRGSDGSTLAVKDFRIRFSVDARVVRVRDIRSGYRARVLKDPRATATDTTPLAVHRAFSDYFGTEP